MRCGAEPAELTAALTQAPGWLVLADRTAQAVLLCYPIRIIRPLKAERAQQEKTRLPVLRPSDRESQPGSCCSASLRDAVRIKAPTPFAHPVE